MKVLHLYAGTHFFGPDRQLLQLYEPLRAEGVDTLTCVLYRQRPELPKIHPLVTRMREHGWPAEQIDVQPRFSWPAIRDIADRIRAGEFAIVHSHEYKSNLYGSLAAQLAGIRRVASVRGYTDRTRALRLYKWADLLVLRAFDAIITVSEDLRQWLVRHGLPASRIVTAPDALDGELFARHAGARTAIRSQFGIGDAEFVIISVGRLSQEKGHSLLLNAARQIVSEAPNVRIMIVGDGPLRDQLEKETKSLQVDHAVIFTGYQSDVAGLLNASDLFVMPSLREGTPNALLEAMALGKPVVATRVGGIPEIVHAGKTGCLVPPQDCSKLTSAIVALMNDPSQAASMGECGRRQVQQKFNAQRLANEIAAVYRQALA